MPIIIRALRSTSIAERDSRYLGFLLIFSSPAADILQQDVKRMNSSKGGIMGGGTGGLLNGECNKSSRAGDFNG
jgi:hypothetical protein